MSFIEIFKTTVYKSHHAFIKNDSDFDKSFFINLNFSMNSLLIFSVLIISFINLNF